MIDVLLKIFGWIYNLWTKLPDDVKSKIIDIIVESFDAIFRAYFKTNQKKAA